ncbi:ATP-dependent DNA helicase [Flagelloscypha sp. PMI_526]|nr:ATP-dependent DNA helicase [Flagelloscypha sp. PMI_526]
MDQAFNVLRNTFGHENFRLSQEQVVRTLLEANDNALVLFPTGGGKSLTFQVPAYGLTLVDALNARGVAAANLDSTLDARRAATVKHDVLNGKLKLLYVAPERLNNEGFMELIRQVKVSLLAIDESHCISQWGSSFRPDYLKIARFAEEMNVERVLCLTATATPEVVEDICDKFSIKRDCVFKTPMYRANLSFNIQTASDQDDKVNQLFPLLRSRTGPCIIYVTLQKHAEEVAEKLRQKDRSLLVWTYHAGLPNDKRQLIQESFMNKSLLTSLRLFTCLTALVAFGMGVDKADIRQVHHLYMPKTLELVRAGRDGLPSFCYMYLCAEDIPILEGFCRGDNEDNIVSFNHYEQSRTSMNVLNLMYAWLELEHGLIRATTPMFTVYDLTVLDINAIQKDDSPTGKTIRQFWKSKTGGYTEYGSKVSRNDLAKKISSWEMNGIPTTEADVKGLGKLLHDKMIFQEEDGIKRLKQVIEFATAENCLAVELAKHFGDPDAVTGGMCNSCTFCRTASAVPFKTTCNAQPDSMALRRILNALPDRDDPLMLARFAFGITCPRLTANKTSMSHPLFGTMVGTEWKALLAAFDGECKAAGYRAAAIPANTGTKRKLAVLWFYNYSA